MISLIFFSSNIVENSELSKKLLKSANCRRKKGLGTVAESYYQRSVCSHMTQNSNKAKTENFGSQHWFSGIAKNCNL